MVRPTLAISCEGRTTPPSFTMGDPMRALPYASNRPSSAASRRWTAHDPCDAVHTTASPPHCRDTTTHDLSNPGWRPRDSQTLPPRARGVTRDQRGATLGLRNAPPPLGRQPATRNHAPLPDDSSAGAHYREADMKARRRFTSFGSTAGGPARPRDRSTHKACEAHAVRRARHDPWPTPTQPLAGARRPAFSAGLLFHHDCRGLSVQHWS